MTDTIHVERFAPPPEDVREMLRYAGAREAAEPVLALLEDCRAEVRGLLTYKVCWRELPVNWKEEQPDLGTGSLTSATLARVLQGCDRAILFAATVGLPLDRLIDKYSRLSPARALMCQAIGTERVESLCDAFCADMAAKEAAHPITRRVSPGYGDIPLAWQREIFRLLDCPRRIGVTLNDSLLMSPSKSVTALFGIGGTPCEDPAGCAACQKADCLFRK